MPLLKLTKTAHGWCFVVCDQPLFNNWVEAWRYGPDIPEFYSVIRQQGVDPARHLHNHAAEVEPRCGKLLEQVEIVYGHIGPARLSKLAHAAGGPQDIATQVAEHFASISSDLIK